jgi:hypothetical protein
MYCHPSCVCVFSRQKRECGFFQVSFVELETLSFYMNLFRGLNGGVMNDPNCARKSFLNEY